MTNTDHPREPAVVWAYRRTGKFAFHALTGALESDPRTAAVSVEFAAGVEGVVASIQHARAAGRNVLVGWSCFSPGFPRLVDELRAVRQQVDDAHVLHLAGGVHASSEPEATLRAGFDLVAVGEGELLIRELVATLRGGGEPGAVRGVAHLDEGGGLRRNGRGARAELDDIPPFAPGHGRFGPIEITRGCVHACRFCQTPHFAGAAFRHRSVDNVRHWARFLVGRGFRDFRFLTPTSLSYGAAGTEPDLAAVEALLAGVREDIGPERKLWFGTFPSELRPEHVTARALRLIARYASNRTLILGAQSGSDRVLVATARGHDSMTVDRAVAMCLEHGFVPHVDFLFGLPGEEEEDVAATCAQMERLIARGAKVHGHVFLPLPGTPLRDAPAGELGVEVRRRLLAMASQGELYGQWQQQEGLAKRLAAARSDSAVPRPGHR